MKYNHDRPLDDFMPEINEIREAGYNPIAVSQMYFEDTFVFETDEEAYSAYRHLERSEDGEYIGKVVGWWHGKQNFLDTVQQYELDNDGYGKVKIYWL